MNITIKQCIAAGLAGFGLVAALGATPTAYASPDTGSGGASIDSGSGPRDVGAKIDDGSGAPGPNFDTPVSIPSVGAKPSKPKADATAEEKEAYEAAVREYEAQVNARMIAEGGERARLIAKEYQRCVAAGEDLC